MDIQGPRDAVMELYPLLDRMQEIFKIMSAGFKLPGPIEVPLPPDKVQSVKDEYMQLRSKIQKLANSIVDIASL